MMLRRCLSLLLVLIAWLAMADKLRAQQAEDAGEVASADYVESAREALGERQSLPWYDAEKDDVRALDIPAPDSKQFNNRASRWDTKPRAPASGTGITAPTWTWGNFFAQVFTGLVVVIGVLLVAFLIYLLVRAYLNSEEAAAVTTARSTVAADETDVERIESLPFTVARPRGDLLDEAMAQYQAGNFRLAVIYLYSYLLIQLDRHQQIHLARGKTNRMYLRELRQQPRLQSILQRTMTSFEDVFFGNHSLSREEFELCWNQLDDFHKQIEQVPV